MDFETLYHAESRRVLATLIRFLGDFDLAEEALHDAFAAAMEQWPQNGVPSNPRAWLVSTGRFKAVDVLRRRARFSPLHSIPEPADLAADPTTQPPEVEDDQLRLIFICCHPALATEARSALTLREVCGLTTEQIARAFLVLPSTLAQRIVRAKNKIKEARIPFEVPSRSELPQRIEAVLQVVYLIFNEGYAASSGASLTRADLSGEAIRLGRLLVELIPEPEVLGLLALMLLQDSRRAARATPENDVILLEDQDRSLWDKEFITEGVALARRAVSSSKPGPYALQAAIAAVHAQASTAPDTDWKRIVGYYDRLVRVVPSPVVELNRAVAVAMAEGPAAGLALVEGLLAQGSLEEYHWAHSVRADLCRKLGKTEEARASYGRALDLAGSEPERRFLRRQLTELLP